MYNAFMSESGELGWVTVLQLARSIEPSLVKVITHVSATLIWRVGLGIYTFLGRNNAEP